MLSNLVYPAMVIVFFFEQGVPPTATNAAAKATSTSTASAATVKPAEANLIEVEKQMLEKTNAQRAGMACRRWWLIAV